MAVLSRFAPAAISRVTKFTWLCAVACIVGVQPDVPHIDFCMMLKYAGGAWSMPVKSCPVQGSISFHILCVVIAFSMKLQIEINIMSVEFGRDQT